jgi:hypothetical protein
MRPIRVPLAALVHWILGAAWYGVLTKPFTALIGPAKLQELAERNELAAFGFAFVASLAIVATLDWLRKISTARRELMVLAAVLAIVASAQAPTVLFEGRPLGLFVLGLGYQIVALGAAAGVLVSTDRR